jgi:hypothetical protein
MYTKQKPNSIDKSVYPLKKDTSENKLASEDQGSLRK